MLLQTFLLKTFFLTVIPIASTNFLVWNKAAVTIGPLISGGKKYFNWPNQNNIDKLETIKIDKKLFLLTK